MIKPNSHLSRLPLYLGMSFFVLTLLFSALKISQKNSLTGSESRANQNLPELILTFLKPDTVSLNLISQTEMRALDIVLKYEPEILEIIPQSLEAGQSFVISLEKTDSSSGIYSFSAISPESDIKSGTIALWKIRPLKSDVKTVLSLNEAHSAIYTSEESSLGFSAADLEINL